MTGPGAAASDAVPRQAGVVPPSADVVPPLLAGADAHGVPLLHPDLVAHYRGLGYWGAESLSDLVRRRAMERPRAAAYVAGTPSRTLTWGEYDDAADRLAAELADAGYGRGSFAAILLPDGLAIHAALLGCARASVLAIGIGARAGDAEIAHLVRTAGASVLITHAEHRGRSAQDLVAELDRRGVAIEALALVEPDGSAPTIALPPGARRRPPLTQRGSEFLAHEVSLLNSTSGTTGLPKCVTQFDHRWLHFAELAIAAGGLGVEDRLLSVVPTPYGFGLWTSHFLGPLLGVPTVVMPRFDPAEMIEILQRDRITVLSAVTTQFRMMLTSEAMAGADLGSLRVMFTGGEAIPTERASQFEDRTGAALLQFFGSNETGAVSCSSLSDPRTERLTTGGRLIAHMHPRVYDDPAAGRLAGVGEPGVPACRGPLTSAGYFRDDAANAQLFTADGWMLMGDVVTVDEAGYLRLVGRSSDIVIRGGKNISAAEVENAVESHPDVTLVSVVPVPDPVFGERVCAVVTLRSGASLDLDGLRGHLAGLGVSPEWWPERLLVVPELPRNAGGKIAKAEVRALAQRLLATASGD